jgi:thioredoxin reductase (NADPH)
MPVSEETYDTIIIGAGPAAMSAAVFTARANLKTLFIGNPEKSQLHNAVSVGNFIGSDGINGPDLLKKGLEQAKKYGARFIQGEVVHAMKREELFTIKTADNKTYRSKTIIICTGAALKPAGIKNEDKLMGKGVHTCVACDGYYYKQKSVAVIGNTNHAAEEAIELLGLTKNVTLISNGKEFEFSPQLKEMLDRGGVKYLEDKITEFKGDKRIEKLITKEGKELAFDGVFLALGSTTAIAFADKLALDTTQNEQTKEKYIFIDRDGKTSLEGCFAAGGCTGGNTQIAKSAGEGCNAAISAIKRIKGFTNYSDLT